MQLNFIHKIQMKFVVRQLACFLLCVTLAVLGYEIASANCSHYQQESYSDIKQAFFSHLNATSEVLNLAVQNTRANKWMEFGLIRKF